MQTFLAYESFHESARVLDNKRLGKQRVEVLQLLRAINGETKGWANHPAARMWRNATPWLVMYGLIICDEWVLRGYRDGCWARIHYYHQPLGAPPVWLGNPEFHASHRSNLLRKDKEWYSRWGWKEPDTLPYIWPV